MKRLAAMFAAATLSLSGCVWVSVGSADVPAMTYYVLADARPAPVAPPAADAKARIAIQGIGADPLSDSIPVVYSRRAGERAFYQFASWTERPSLRLTLLAQQRLEARGRFAAAPPVGEAAAQAAVAAFAVAAADVLDPLVEWVETTVAAHTRP